MTKRARGRSIFGKINHNTKRRWFELRCEEQVTSAKYMLFYFKNMGDNKPKGALKLTALDSIFFDEENPSELMTLTLENDEETDTHTLEIQAETTAEAEKWIFSFQNSISDLNRLTVITEEGNESLTSSDTSKPIPGDRPATERLDVNWGKGTSKKNVGENVMSMIGLGRGKGTSIRTDSTSSRWVVF